MEPEYVIRDPQKLPPISLSPNVTMEMRMPPISASKTHCLHGVESSEKPGESLVSTVLCLYDETWPSENTKTRKKSTDDHPKVSWRPMEEERDLARMRLLSNQEREEEERYGVSTELTLFSDPWTIKKTLAISDLGHLSRLLLEGSTVHSHILRYLPRGDQRKVQQGSGLRVNVYDHDTHSVHQLLLKKWTKSRYYVLNGGWLQDFVCRRDLKNEDEIGMFWDRFDSKFHFRVLSRAPAQVSSGPVTIASYTPLLADPLAN